VDIQLTLSQASAACIAVVAAGNVLKFAIEDEHRCRRLIAVLAACALLWLLLRGPI
jgi:hypothetical protein